MINIKGKILDSNHKYKKLLLGGGGKILKHTQTSSESFPSSRLLNFIVNNSMGTVIQSYIVVYARSLDESGEEILVMPLSALTAGKEDNLRTISMPLLGFTVVENMEGIDLNKFNIAYKKIRGYFL